MGTIKEPKPVKLIIGMISSQKALFQEAVGFLQRKFSPIDHQSKIMPFIHTEYYQKEMGTDLLRFFVSFKELIDPAFLAQIKIYTNELEEAFSQVNEDGVKCRRINLDPGYIALDKLVLASTKNYWHRIYIGMGIWAEVTLKYTKKQGFVPVETTYPDYKTHNYLNFFSEVRKVYVAQLKEI
jgi:hypothetical protein